MTVLLAVLVVVAPPAPPLHSALNFIPFVEKGMFADGSMFRSCSTAILRGHVLPGSRLEPPKTCRADHYATLLQEFLESHCHAE